METDREQRQHRCRVCTKRFSSGRSLGGHMRSHPHSPPSNAGETEKLGSGRGQPGLGLGYDLRENPKKTSRLSDFAEGDFGAPSKHCKDCGKGFPSWKALFGHMRCHSERTCPRTFEEEEEGSWGEEMGSMESFSDDNEPPRRRPLMAVPKKKRSSKRAFPATAAAAAASSSSITGYELEQEDVAISLMMLSRAIGEFSDKTSWVLDKEVEEEESVNESRSRIPSSASLRKKRAMLGNSDDPFNGFNLLGSRYECINCKKSFPSYHALGGHRANHKRNKNCRGGGENTCFNAGASTEHLPVTVGKSRIHECAVCGKTFSSGQALGGHKRSHLISNGGGGGSDHPINEVWNPPAIMGLSEDVSEPLDLNLPAPADEASSNLKSWWAQSSELSLRLI